jgi:hypothetical protein
VECPQRVLKRLTFHRQAVAVACVKTSQRMIGGHAREQCHCCCALASWDQAMNSACSTSRSQLIVQAQARVSISARRSSPSAKVVAAAQRKIRGAFTGAGIHLATVTLHVGHQPSWWENAQCPEQQMFQKVRQAGPCQGHVMAAAATRSGRGAALQTRRMTRNPGRWQGQVKMMGWAGAGMGTET